MLDGDLLLKKIDAMPITRWNYKTEPASMQHIGPMAQDFYSAFRLGTDSLTISTADENGVTLAAVQALNRKLEASIKAMAAQIDQLNNKVALLSSTSQKESDENARLENDEKEIAQLKEMINSITGAQAHK